MKKPPKPRLIESSASEEQGPFTHQVTINGRVIAQMTHESYAALLAATLRRVDLLHSQRGDKDVLQTALDLIIFIRNRQKLRRPKRSPKKKS